MSGSDQSSGTQSPSRGPAVIEIEPLLWKRFLEAPDQETLTEAWLVLLCRQIGASARVEQGALILLRDGGGFAPAALFPSTDESASERLAFAAEKALTEGAAVAHQAPQYPEEIHIAWPIRVDGVLIAAVVVAVNHDADSSQTLRQMQWSGGWISALWKDRRNQTDALTVAVARLMKDSFGVGLKKEALAGFLSQLADLVGASRVGFGQMVGGGSGQSISLVAVSGTVQAEGTTEFGKGLVNAMKEAWDQDFSVTSPAIDDGGPHIAIAHNSFRELTGAASVLSVPVEVTKGRGGVLTFEFKGIKDGDFIARVSNVAVLPGNVLLQSLETDKSPLRQIASAMVALKSRVMRPRLPSEKLALAGALLLPVIVALWPIDYEVTSPATVEGVVQRHIVVAQDGIIASAEVRAGETVQGGQEIARLDNRELILERLSAETRRRQLVAEEARALAQRDLAGSRIVSSQIKGAESEIQLLDTRLELTRFVAPYDGLVIAGDLSQRIGAAVGRGETLFIIAPLDGFRILLRVDEEDVASVAVGQSGRMVLPSRPGEVLAYEIERLTPVAIAADGRNAFHVEARMVEAPDWVRPGMQGVSRTTAGKRALAWVWTHRLTTFLRLKLWSLAGI